MSESTEKFSMPEFEERLRKTLEERGRKKALFRWGCYAVLLEQDYRQGVVPTDHLDEVGAELARIHRAVFGETPPEGEAP